MDATLLFNSINTHEKAEAISKKRDCQNGLLGLQSRAISNQQIDKE